MAKKFGKFLLFTVAAGTALAGAYYYLQKNLSWHLTMTSMMMTIMMISVKI